MNIFVKTEPFVDVILPNYNKAEFLEDAINSVINQTYKNWHLYIIDDYSSDNSIKIINKFLNLENVNIVKLEKNMGPSFCRNYGMRLSKSKYISFLDSDDSWSEDKLEKQIFFMEKNDFGFTYTDYIPFFENKGMKKFKKRTFLKNFFDFKTFIKNSSINTTTMIISRSILGTHRFKKIKLLEDYLFKCDLFKSNNTARKLSESLGFYRILVDSRSSQRLKNIYWLWHINKNYNNLNIFQNMISIFFISMNSIKKYGIK
ncbi:MAG: glycosyltransferase family 2 protein [Pelagibacteraceae bacterium]|jgi:teichuronic acid biosynthesis glycosyltransferase TuaG|nr:glycosyltransferase family 2 protein [Pelagibacteraceae bacterium]MDP6710796.1 glycosyltransferase family 2 protein [Pelagibacteraceae bacterium]|tara:strand:+ start:42 stop:818 length:777 start_codon:yes stop_codon:yes gene_type:complete